MRKHGKRIISCILAFSMIAGLFLTSEPMETEAAKTVTLYEENFDDKTITDLTTAGWAGNTAQYAVSNNTYQGRNGNTYYANTDAYSWTNYTFESDFIIGTKNNTAPTSSSYYGVRFGINASGNGVEYRIRQVVDNGTITYQYHVHDRINSYTYANNLSIGDQVLEMDKVMKLKVELATDSFTVYLNDVPLNTFTKKYDIVGSIGTRMDSTQVLTYYDNMKVTKEVDVAEKAAYENNFDNATIDTLTTEGWSGLTQYEMSNGVLCGKNANAYYNNADAYNWTDYTYETKMTIATKNATNTVDGYFGIRFNVGSDGNGIEYGIHYKSEDQSFAYRVYDRRTNGESNRFLIQETSLAGKGLALDQQMTLKVKVEGNTFTIYLNGESLGSATSSSDISGTIGTLMSASTVYLLYDDMKVTKEVLQYTVKVDTDLVEIVTDQQDGNTSTTFKYCEGDIVTVKVTGDIAANGLTYVTETDSVVKNIFAQPVGTEKGTGAGNTFVFTMPADNITLQAVAYAGVEDSMASVATALAEEGNAIRFLNRIYLPDLFGNEFDGTTTVASGEYSGYTIKDCGAIVLPKDWIAAGHQLELENQYVGKVSMSSTETFKLYDKTTKYLDFTLKITNVQNESRVYSVTTYVTLENGSETVTLYGNTVEQSIESLKGAY